MPKPQVTILMATYNGAAYLKEQLDSIKQQTHTRWQIIASDDGSSDETLNLLHAYGVKTIHGPHKGFAANFMSLVRTAPLDSEFYAFSDQDDVWAPEKLTRALHCLSSYPQEVPALYCGRTHLVNESLISIGYSPLFKKSPHFKNALVQNIGGGNTMVFNKKALELLQQLPEDDPIVAHDWWAYLLVSGAGGNIYYDEKPYIDYRQHQANLIGSNRGWRAQVLRLRSLFKGKLKSWLDSNSKNLSNLSHVLTPDNKRTFEAFEAMRGNRSLLKLIKTRRLGLYRQTRLGQLGLVLAAIFNKI